MVVKGLWEYCRNHKAECTGKNCYDCVSLDYFDNSIYPYIYNKRVYKSAENKSIDNSLLVTQSVGSAEWAMDIVEGMEEEEVRAVIDGVLKSEYEAWMTDNQRDAMGHKRNRFFIKAMRGVSCGFGREMRFRWFTCTESDEAIEMEIDMRGVFHKFFTMLRYHCPDFQYIVIEHRQGDCWRRNWHILSYGSDKLPLEIMSEWWRDNIKSVITGMAEVKYMASAVKYVAGYLAEPEKYIRSFHSQGWVFPGWLKYSREFHKQYGFWPHKERLIELALMPVDKRKLIMECYVGEPE